MKRMKAHEQLWLESFRGRQGAGQTTIKLFRHSGIKGGGGAVVISLGRGTLPKQRMEPQTIIVPEGISLIHRQPLEGYNCSTYTR